jgi:hypothetical protein
MVFLISSSNEVSTAVGDGKPMEVTSMPTDVAIENGWSVGANHSHAIIGVFAQTEKGEVFLTAYFRETAFGSELDNDDVIGSASLLPKDFDQFKRMAAAAGVRLADHRREVLGYRRAESRAN